MWINLIIKNTRIQSIIIIVVFSLFLTIQTLIFGEDWMWISIAISILLLLLIFRFELRNLLKRLLIIQTNRINYFTIFFGLCWIVFALFFHTNEGELIWGINDLKLSYFSLGLTFFFQRDNYLIISRNYIKHNKSGMFKGGRTKILWNKISNVEIKENSIRIESDTKRIEIENSELKSKDINTIKRMLYHYVDKGQINEDL